LKKQAGKAKAYPSEASALQIQDCWWKHISLMIVENYVYNSLNLFYRSLLNSQSSDQASQPGQVDQDQQVDNTQFVKDLYGIQGKKSSSAPFS